MPSPFSSAHEESNGAAISDPAVGQGESGKEGSKAPAATADAPPKMDRAFSLQLQQQQQQEACTPRLGKSSGSGRCEYCGTSSLMGQLRWWSQGKHRSRESVLQGVHMCRVGQNRMYAPYMAVYLVLSLRKIPCMHRIYMVLANLTYVCVCGVCVCVCVCVVCVSVCVRQVRISELVTIASP